WRHESVRPAFVRCREAAGARHVGKEGDGAGDWGDGQGGSPAAQADRVTGKHGASLISEKACTPTSSPPALWSGGGVPPMEMYRHWTPADFISELLKITPFAGCDEQTIRGETEYSSGDMFQCNNRPALLIALARSLRQYFNGKADTRD